MGQNVSVYINGFKDRYLRQRLKFLQILWFGMMILSFNSFDKARESESDFLFFGGRRDLSLVYVHAQRNAEYQSEY